LRHQHPRRHVKKDQQARNNQPQKDFIPNAHDAYTKRSKGTQAFADYTTPTPAKRRRHTIQSLKFDDIRGSMGSQGLTCLAYHL
jgi:hypothetical protein